MIYHVRAYSSKIDGESGRVTPICVEKTNQFLTAEHNAKQLSSHYGATVLENRETGNKIWYVKK